MKKSSSANQKARANSNVSNHWAGIVDWMLVSILDGPKFPRILMFKARGQTALLPSEFLFVGEKQYPFANK
jgi:hypothetical protein